MRNSREADTLPSGRGGFNTGGSGVRTIKFYFLGSGSELGWDGSVTCLFKAYLLRRQEFL